MKRYLLKRLLLIVPTLFGVLVVNFALIQLAPGGPAEQMIFTLTNPGAISGAQTRVGGSSSDSGQAEMMTAQQTTLQNAQVGLDPELVERIRKMYGYDKPPLERFWLMLRSYATLDFGESFFRDTPVIDLIIDKLPVSISLGLWTTLIVYLVSIPLGIRKAVRDGSAFDGWSSTLVAIGHAIPSFVFAILLVFLFAGGRYWQLFPLQGLISEGWSAMTWDEKILDYFWHMALPVTAMVMGGFASLALLTKNCFIDEISKQYVMTARAKGLKERRILYRHVFRNAMLIIIAGMPAALIGILFTGSLIIEIIFSLDGLGLLGYEAVLSRDYPVIFGTLFIFSLIGLVVKIISDTVYVLVDPRIDFERRDG